MNNYPDPYQERRNMESERIRKEGYQAVKPTPSIFASQHTKEGAQMASDVDGNFLNLEQLAKEYVLNRRLIYSVDVHVAFAQSMKSQMKLYEELLEKVHQRLEQRSR